MRLFKQLSILLKKLFEEDNCLITLTIPFTKPPEKDLKEEILIKTVNRCERELSIMDMVFFYRKLYR